MSCISTAANEASHGSNVTLKLTSLRQHFVFINVLGWLDNYIYSHLIERSNTIAKQNQIFKKVSALASSRSANKSLKNSLSEVDCASFFFLQIQFLNNLKADSAIKLNAPLTKFSSRDLLPAILFGIFSLNVLLQLPAERFCVRYLMGSHGFQTVPLIVDPQQSMGHKFVWA